MIMAALKKWLSHGVPLNTVLLLSMLGVILLVGPLVEERSVGVILYHVAMTGTYVTALLANRQRKLVFRIGVGFAAGVILLTWMDVVYDTPVATAVSHFAAYGYLCFTAWIILLAVFREQGGTSRALLGVLSVYLLIGIAWARLYSAIELVQPGAFDVPNRRVIRISYGDTRGTAMSQYTYFSFVTLSTLGYGDIQPRIPIAETVTWTESILGQFFLAVIVARMVSIIPEDKRRRSAPSIDPDAPTADEQ